MSIKKIYGKLLSTENTFLVLSVLLFLWIRFHHFNIPLECDEGEYAYAGQEILRGKLPYKDFYNMKFPGTYYFYSLIFYFLGDSNTSIKIILLFINLSSACFVYGIARIWYNKQIGKLAAGIFLIFCSCYSAQGWTANSEHFVVFFGVIGIYFSALYALRQKFFYLFFAGFFLAVATLCKQQGFMYAIFPIFQLLIHKTTFNWRRIFTLTFLRAIAIYAIGFIIPVGSMIVYFYKKNILDDFYFFALKYAFAYINLKTPIIGVVHFRHIVWDGLGFWLLFFAFIYNAFRYNGYYKKHLNSLLFLSCTFIATSFGWYYRPHYFQLMFPPSAIMSAYVLKNITDLSKYKYLNVTTYTIFSFLLVIILQLNYLFIGSSEKISDLMYGITSYNTTRMIGEKIKTNFKDRHYNIGMIGSDPEIFFYSQLRSKTGFMYMYPLFENQQYASAFTNKFKEEFDNNRPEIMIYFYDFSFGKNKKNIDNITNWYLDELKNYIAIGKVDTISGKEYLKWVQKGQDSVDLNRNSIDKIYLRKDIKIPDNFYE